jgi:tetratricopeptide (TPR) repeat protein
MEPPLLLAVRTPIAPFVTGLDANAPARASLDAAWDAQGFVLAASFDRAREVRPESETVRLFEERLAGARSYYLALADRYSDDVDESLEAANQLATLGHPDDAKPLFERALSRWPSDFRVRLNFALLLERLRDTNRAIAMLSRLRDEQPTSAVVLFDLGAALLDAGDAAGAKVQLDLALQWDPSHFRARLALAVADLALGDLASAEREASKVASDEPFVPEAQDVLGVVALRRGDFDRAIDHHAAAIRLQPYRAVSHYDLAVADRSKGDLDRAEAEYVAALHVDPRFAAAEVELGMTLALEGKGGAAADAYCRALAIDATIEAARAALKKLNVDPQTCGS